MAKIQLFGNIQGYSSAQSARNTPVTTCVHLKNMYVRNGELRKRAGIHIRDVTGFDIDNTAFKDGFMEFDFSGRTIIWLNAANSWRSSGAFGNPSSIAPVTSGSTGSRFKRYANGIFIACRDKTRKYYNSSGLGMYDTGLPVPVKPGIGITTGVGTWSGLVSVTYEYVTTWVSTNSDRMPEIESIISPSEIANPGGTADTIDITRPALSSVDTEHNATHWRVYRRIQILGGLYYRIITQDIAIASAGPFNDGGGISNFQLPGPIDHTEPPGADDIEYWKLRLWYIDATDKEKLRFSKLDFPEYVPSVNVFIVGSQRDPMKRLLAFDQFLLIIKLNSVWAIEGNSLLSFRLREVLRNNGTISEAMRYEHYAYWINARGIWQWDSNTKQLTNIALQIWNDFKGMTVANIRMTPEPEEGHIWFGEKGSSNFYIFDPQTGRFVGVYSLASGTTFSGFGDMSDNTNPAALALGANDGANDELHTYNVSGVADETQFDAEVFLGMNYGQEQDIIIRNIKVYDEQGVTATTTEAITVYTMTPDQTPSNASSKGNITFNQWAKSERGINEQSPFISIGLKIANSQIARDWRITGLELDVEDKIGVR